MVLRISNIQYRIATEDRYEEVLDVLKKHFWTDEPISNCLGFTGIKEVLDDLHARILTRLKESLTIIAIDKTSNKVVGASVNSIFHKDHKVKMTDEIARTPLALMFQLVGELHSNVKPNVYEELDTDFLFNILCLSVPSDCRQLGLGSILVEKSIALAKLLGLKGCKTEASAVYSRQVFEKHGFEPRSTIVYADFEVDGKKVLKDVKPPHNACVYMIKKL